MSHAGVRILIVDDEPHIREVVRFTLQRAGFDTAEAGDGQAALEQFESFQPDLIILDILMPQLDGTEVCRRIRRDSNVPIVFLSSRDDEIDRIIGLELGGDDYVTKPFSPRELLARVRAVLRRTRLQAQPPGDTDAGSGVLQCGLLKLDLDRFKVWWGDTEVVLTVTEFNLVRALMGFPGKVYTRDELLTRAYDDDSLVGDRTIDSHVRRIRQKFSQAGGQPIETVHGLGYKLKQ